MIEKFGVLYTDASVSAHHHLLLQDGTIVQSVLVHDRKADGDVYIALDSIMKLHKIEVLWVHPDTPLSVWVTSADFTLIPEGLKWYTPPLTHASDKPYALALGKNHLVMFPAYVSLKHNNNQALQKWDMGVNGTPDVLLHSVDYLQRSIDFTLKYTAGATALNMLRAINTRKNNSRLVERIKPMHYDRWNTVRGKVVARPLWSHRLRNGQRGLTDEQKSKLFVVGGDKNAQFLGGCMKLVLSNGEPSEITNISVMNKVYHDAKIPSLWEYKITDVSKSRFNSYELYCPLSRRDTWASGELLRFCENQGIEFELVRGLAWREIAGKVLEQWAHRMWFAISGLRNHEERFPDTIARENALSTSKKMYVEAIGRFNAEYSKEYYQRAWNTMIIHQAIKNQMASFTTRIDNGASPVLVCNDAFYVLTDEPTLELAYPGILDHTTELRGYKNLGACPLSDTIIQAFEQCTPLQIEQMIKKGIQEYATIR
jgi:hypothetical protein